MIEKMLTETVLNRPILITEFKKSFYFITIHESKNTILKKIESVRNFDFF
jgi:hypothetical protein